MTLIMTNSSKQSCFLLAGTWARTRFSSGTQSQPSLSVQTLQKNDSPRWIQTGRAMPKQQIRQGYLNIKTFWTKYPYSHSSTVNTLAVWHIRHDAVWPPPLTSCYATARNVYCIEFSHGPEMCGISLTVLYPKLEVHTLVEFKPMDYSSALNDMQYAMLQQQTKKSSSFYGTSSNSGLQQTSDYSTGSCLVRRMQMNKVRTQSKKVTRNEKQTK